MSFQIGLFWQRQNCYICTCKIGSTKNKEMNNNEVNKTFNESFGKQGGFFKE